MHLLKNLIDSLVLNMCMHETYNNDDGHNRYQQHGIDIDDLKKCVNCMKKKNKMVYFLTIILYMVLKKLFKALTLLYNGMLIHGVSPSELLIGTIVSFQKCKRKAHHSSKNYRALTLGSITGKLYDAFIMKQQTGVSDASDL